ncbi:hypothetical protein R3P38DRAFT_474329 [Favolaschia claudopus]|uniref:Uncharacterized protein n=1 Tax=Favolaschia claudopus TaxID=2862362 RepID=A0AAW0CJZ1_9AGAR
MATSVETFIQFIANLEDGNQNTPGIENKIHKRLEWTWGLLPGTLAAHLKQFRIFRAGSRLYLPQETSSGNSDRYLMDEGVVLFPRTRILSEAASCWTRDSVESPPERVDEAYDKHCSFNTYLAVSLDDMSPTLSRPHRYISDLPLHLIVLTTYAKLLRCWGDLQPSERTAKWLSLVRRAHASDPTCRTFFASSQFREMEVLYARWLWGVDVADADAESRANNEDQTRLQQPTPVSTVPTTKKRKSTGDAAGDATRSDPRRRLGLLEDRSLPLQPFSRSVNVSARREAQTFTMSFEEIEGERAIRRLLESVHKWLDTSAEAYTDERWLLNDDEIDDDSRERVRKVKTCDLRTPDYKRFNFRSKGSVI